MPSTVNVLYSTKLTLTAFPKHEPSVCVQRWMSWPMEEAARCCQCESFAQRLWYERTAASSNAASVCVYTAASNPVSSACTDYNHTKQWHADQQGALYRALPHLWNIYIYIYTRVLKQGLEFDLCIIRTRYKESFHCACFNRFVQNLSKCTLKGIIWNPITCNYHLQKIY